MSALLRKAICNVSGKVNRVLDRCNDADIDATGMREARELLVVLARIADGMDTRKAFGAPGDWGYENEIGQGVWQLLSSPNEPGRS